MNANKEIVSLMPMLNLYKWLNLALMPVRPNAGFRHRLGQRLVAEAARLHSAHQTPAWLAFLQSLLQPGRREIVIGATVGSLISIAGLIALIIHLVHGHGVGKQPVA